MIISLNSIFCQRECECILSFKKFADDEIQAINQESCTPVLSVHKNPEEIVHNYLKRGETRNKRGWKIINIETVCGDRLFIGKFAELMALSILFHSNFLFIFLYFH